MCPEPISFSKFTSEACRPISTNVKSIQLLFDVQEGLEVLSFKAEVPQGLKVDLIWCRSEDGRASIMKVLYIPRRISFQAATALCAGKALNIKKGVQWLLSRLGGYQLQWHTIQEKAPTSSLAQTSKRCPSNQELEEGINFIMTMRPNVTLATSRHCGY